MEFHTFSVKLLAAVITVLSWRSHATMVTFSFVTLSSSGGGLYFLGGRGPKTLDSSPNPDPDSVLSEPQTIFSDIDILFLSGCRA
ncbi:hypothetical protein AMECASPLE_038090 [Ameca splendens]|uniref:Secreted protein n=1 Tax=Ameca splendens TaxID=208324 RepID=A0ABV0Z6F9_9TELE